MPPWVVSTHVSRENAVQEGIRRSDLAMYAAKSLGRNRVVRWEQVGREPDESAGIAVREPAAEPLAAARAG
jgi:hypothetical protein